MHIIIAGHGKVGITLLQQLSQEGHDLTMIDMNRTVLDGAVTRHDVMAVQGNCAAQQVLLDAGVMDADLLIAVTGADEVNLLSCMTAHGLNPNLHTIARIRNPEYTQQSHQMRDLFALSMTVNEEAQAAKEMERLGIDLSWKSSEIEGNTYTLLETVNLLKDKIEAKGKKREEAIMLLNHKAALKAIVEQSAYFKELSLARMEDVHSVLIEELGVERNLRHIRVGISGTRYRPLEVESQIREAVEDMCALVNGKSDPYEKALLALLLIAYIQPFTDGNKRTSRLMANSLLISRSLCPLSFRTVEANDYRAALLLFYEQNNISAFKKMFLEQIEFAMKEYF